MFFLILVLLISACNTNTRNEYNKIETNIVGSKFIGNKSCKSCHQEEYSGWSDSHHANAMQVADSTTILGNFNNITFEQNNLKSFFFIKENEYYVNTEGPEGNYRNFKIRYTFGFTPLQQYIIQFPNGEYQCLLTAWDTEKNKWFYLQPNLEIKHNEWLHWTGGSMRWNTMCADCHSTNLQKNFNSETDSYATTFSEINVSCEACHGPAKVHVDFYQNPVQGMKPEKLLMNDSISSIELVDKCARCHSRRSQFTKKLDFTKKFLDHYNPSLLVDPIYELDGQIKDEDYVYGSFIQSKMYHNGVSCKDCHDSHSLKLKKTGNALCLNCHTTNYSTPSHHFHNVESEGAKCINCHMPGKIYMGNDFRRDHSFRSPRPDQTLNYNVPNACNTCHKDKSAEWANDFINLKYGSKRAHHFSDLLLKGHSGDNLAFIQLFSNKKYPEIVRATALNQYGIQNLSKNEIERLTMYLKDSSALVRKEAISVLEKTENILISKQIKPLLADSVRLVRIAAARYFIMIGQEMNDNKNFIRANNEYLEELDFNSDFASGQNQIAIYNQAIGNKNKAIEAFKKAIEIDNYFNISRMNLALLYYQQGNAKESEELYLKVIEQEPEYSHPYYMLGLLYNETNEINKALAYLATACSKKPKNINAYYNYALLLNKEGQNNKSLEVINEALRVFPNTERLLYIKLIVQLSMDLNDDSRITCLKLLEIAPDNTNYIQILQRIDNKKSE